MELAIDLLATKTLYRFQTTERKDYVSRIFTHDELYLSSPSQLNDPWESKPHVTLGDLSDQQVRNRYVEYHAQLMLEGNPGRDPKKVRQYLNSLNQQQAETLVQEFIDGWHAALEALRIFSLSANCVHPLLWAHYAKAHSGICLVFDASTDYFGNAFKVNYSQQYPVIDASEHDDEEILRVAVLSKADFWEYEEEYRLVSMEPSEPSAIRVTNHICNFSRELLTGVIFGCLTPDEERTRIISLCKKTGRNLRFQQCRVQKSQYALDIIDC